MRQAALGLAASLLLAAPAWAQQPPAAVGRVSFIAGTLDYHLATDTQWSAATVNYPVATGTSFWAGADEKSRGEVQIGAETIGMSANTELDIVRLDDQGLQISVPQGQVCIRVHELPQGYTIENDVPRGAVSVEKAGFYYIDAGTDDQPARISVFRGAAQFTGGATQLGIKEGDAAVIGGGNPLTANVEHAAADDFVKWCQQRDGAAQRAVTARTGHRVSWQMTGAAELDQYGAWSQAPQYGDVWYPASVPANWAPYREGHWANVPPWGWTWVDNEPWGFAPFHYGRWARIGGRWAWVPGRYAAQPVYAPALVAFVGNPNAGIPMVGAPGPVVGWFPLAPDEVYVPPYTRDPGYIRQLNVPDAPVTKIVNITNIIVNAPKPSPSASAATGTPAVTQTFANRAAATVVPVKTFAGSGAVQSATVKVAPTVLQQTPVTVVPPKVTPVAQAAKPPEAAGHGGPPPIHPAANTAGEPTKPGTPATNGGPPPIHPPANTAGEPTKPGSPATNGGPPPVHPPADTAGEPTKPETPAANGGPPPVHPPANAAGEPTKPGAPATNGGPPLIHPPGNTAGEPVKPGAPAANGGPPPIHTPGNTAGEPAKPGAPAANGAPPHPGAAEHATPAHPIEPPHPSTTEHATPLHSVEPPHPSTVEHAGPPRPAEPSHAAEPPHPSAVEHAPPPHAAEPPHQNAAEHAPPPHPAEPPRPAPAPLAPHPEPTAPPRPAPAPPPHPEPTAAPRPAPAPPPHPEPAAAPHPAPPSPQIAPKPQPKHAPGEPEEKKQE